MTNKEKLEKFIENYNYFQPKEKQIVFNKTDKYIGVELGNHWISKIFTINPSDKEYEELFFYFFNFLCVLACNKIPNFEKIKEANKAVEVLKNHNDWRKGLEGTVMTEPKQLTESIDVLIDYVKNENWNRK